MYNTLIGDPDKDPTSDSNRSNSLSDDSPLARLCLFVGVSTELPGNLSNSSPTEILDFSNNELTKPNKHVKQTRRHHAQLQFHLSISGMVSFTPLYLFSLTFLRLATLLLSPLPRLTPFLPSFFPFVVGFFLTEGTSRLCSQPFGVSPSNQVMMMLCYR